MTPKNESERKYHATVQRQTRTIETDLGPAEIRVYAAKHKGELYENTNRQEVFAWLRLERYRDLLREKLEAAVKILRVLKELDQKQTSGDIEKPLTAIFETLSVIIGTLPLETVEPPEEGKNGKI